MHFHTGSKTEITGTMLVLTLQFHAMEDMLLILDFNGDTMCLFFLNIHNRKTNELVDFYHGNRTHSQYR